MSEHAHGEDLFLLVVSLLVLASVLVRVGARRYLGVPPVVGYMLLGLGLRGLQQRFGWLSPQAEWSLSFLAELGVAALLFHVGLKSDLRSLQAELPRALAVWVWNVALAAMVAFVATRLLGFGLVPGLFVATAMSATSVGVSVAVWSDLGRLRSRLGALLIDVAELDDLSAVILMLTVVAAAPALHGGESVAVVLGAALQASGLVMAKVLAFAFACFLFARFAEPAITRVLSRAQRPPERVLTLVGIGFGVAAFAGVVGFSVAVGALFAGLMFSRDPRAVHQEASFGPIYALFTPFFFIEVGYALQLETVAQSFGLGCLLLVPAVLGKVAGGGIPIAGRHGWPAALIFGVSMVPRAEIALLIARAGNQLGPWAMPDRLYSAVVIAFALTAIGAPLALQRLFQRYPQVASAHGQPHASSDDPAVPR